MSGLVGDRGTHSYLVGPDVHCEFYQSTGDGQTSFVAGTEWILSRNMESYWAYVTGIIPNHMIRVKNIEVLLHDGQNHVPSYGEQGLRMGWAMAGPGQADDTHTLSATTVSGTWAQVDGRKRVRGLLGVGSSGSRFEDLASPGDMFTMKFNRTVAVALYLTGVWITYEMNQTQRPATPL